MLSSKQQQDHIKNKKKKQRSKSLDRGLNLRRSLGLVSGGAGKKKFSAPPTAGNNGHVVYYTPVGNAGATTSGDDYPNSSSAQSSPRSYHELKGSSTNINTDDEWLHRTLQSDEQYSRGIGGYNRGRDYSHSRRDYNQGQYISGEDDASRGIRRLQSDSGEFYNSHQEQYSSGVGGGFVSRSQCPIEQDQGMMGISDEGQKKFARVDDNSKIPTYYYGENPGGNWGGYVNTTEMQLQKLQMQAVLGHVPSEAVENRKNISASNNQNVAVGYGFGSNNSIAKRVERSSASSSKSMYNINQKSVQDARGSSNSNVLAINKRKHGKISFGRYLSVFSLASSKGKNKRFQSKSNEALTATPLKDYNYQQRTAGSSFSPRSKRQQNRRDGPPIVTLYNEHDESVAYIIYERPVSYEPPAIVATLYIAFIKSGIRLCDFDFLMLLQLFQPVFIVNCIDY